MNRAELIKAISEDIGQTVSQEKICNIIVSAMNNIKQAVAEGDSVMLVGFGTFSKAHRNARICRNIQTGEKIKVPAREIARFVPGKKFKALVAATHKK